MWNSSVLNITYLNKELYVFNINVKSSIGAKNVFHNCGLFRAQLIWFPLKKTHRFQLSCSMVIFIRKELLASCYRNYEMDVQESLLKIWR